MKSVAALTSRDSIRKLTKPELLAGSVVMKRCMNVQSTERVLIVTDAAKFGIEAAIFFETAKQFTNNVTLLSLEGMTGNAQEPPEAIRKSLANTDVGLLITTYSLSHTTARINACREGARIASMPGITKDIILRTLAIDYKTLADVSTRVARMLSKGFKATLTSQAGTNLDLIIENRRGIADTGILKNSGDFGNLPAGEAFIAPLEIKTNGTLVIDGALANIELDQMITLNIRKGSIKNIVGGKAAETLEQTIDSIGGQARVVCELGVGTNPTARLSPQILEAEKVYGTCHVAFGKNKSFGGIIDVPFHTDGVVKNPTLVVDGVAIVKDGKILNF